MGPTKTNGTVLLGDDELEVRNYLEMALKCQGYSVELAQDGDEVLGYLHDSEAPVSAVLLDIIMPRKAPTGPRAGRSHLGGDGLYGAGPWRVIRALFQLDTIRP